MTNLSPDSQKLLVLLSSGKKLTAMVAPSFPADFTEDQIVCGLKLLGFDKVVDHSVAILSVNKAYEEYFQKNPNSIVIAANCPATVNLVKTKFPELAKYILPIFSPILTMGKFLKKKYPENINVFIGPCLAKKGEIKGHENEVSLVITYKEIIELFSQKGIDFKNPSKECHFDDDLHNEFLAVFPASGGVKATFKEGLLKDNEFIVCDGPGELIKLFTEMKESGLPKEVKFLDVLFCRGGCIGGPGVASDCSLECRKKKFMEYNKFKKNQPLCSQADARNAIDQDKCIL